MDTAGQEVTLDAWVATLPESHRARAELAQLKARVKQLKREVWCAAGMLSTYGEWAEKHPQDALDAIRKAAKETGPADGEQESVT